MPPRLECSPTMVPIAPDVFQVAVLLSDGLVTGLPLRMTVIVGDEGAVVISPVPLDDETWAALTERVGVIAHVVAPNLNHHLFVQSFLDRCDAAQMAPTLWTAPGLVEKVGALKSATAKIRVLDDDVEVVAGLSQRLLRGVPKNNEVVFFHTASGTLIVTDAMMSIRRHPYFSTRLMFRLIGAYGGEKQPLLWRVRATEKGALRDSVDAVLRWPIARVVGAHGDVVDDGAAAAIADVFRWVPKA